MAPPPGSDGIGVVVVVEVLVVDGICVIVVEVF